LDARGAAMGSIGLACFAISVLKLLPVCSSAVALLAATAVWCTISTLIWRLRRVARVP